MEREREKKNPEQSGVTQLVIYKYIKFFVIAHKEKRWFRKIIIRVIF